MKSKIDVYPKSTESRQKKELHLCTGDYFPIEKKVLQLHIDSACAVPISGNMQMQLGANVFENLIAMSCARAQFSVNTFKHHRVRVARCNAQLQTRARVCHIVSGLPCAQYES